MHVPNFGHLVAVYTHKKTTATLEQIALQNVFLFVSVPLNNFLKEKKQLQRKACEKNLKMASRLNPQPCPFDLALWH